MSFLGASSVDEDEVRRMRKQLKQQDMEIGQLQSLKQTYETELSSLRSAKVELATQLDAETQRATAAEGEAKRAKDERARSVLQISNLETALDNEKRAAQEGLRGRRREEVERDRALGLHSKETEEERKQLEARVKQLESQLGFSNEELRRLQQSEVSTTRRAGRVDPAAHALALENEVSVLKSEISRLRESSSALGAATPVKPAGSRRRPRRSSIGGSALAPGDEGEIKALRVDVAKLDEQVKKANERAEKGEKAALKASNELIVAQRGLAAAKEAAKEATDELREELRWAQKEADELRSELDAGAKGSSKRSAPTMDPKVQQELEDVKLQLASKVQACAQVEAELITRTRQAEESLTRAQAAEKAANAAQERVRALQASASAGEGLDPQRDGSAVNASSSSNEGRVVRELRRELKSVTQARDALQVEISQLEDEFEKLGNQGDAASKKDEFTSELRERVRSLEMERDTLASQAAEHASLQDVGGKGKEIDALQEELEQANAERDRLVKDLEEARGALTEASEHHRQLQERLSTQKEHVSLAQDRIATLERELESSQPSSADGLALNELRALLQQSESLVESLRADVSATGDAVSNAHKDLHSAQSGRQELEQRLAESERRREVADAELTALQAEAAAPKEVEDLKIRLDQAQQELEAARQLVRERDGLLTQLQDASEKANEALQEQNDKIAQLERLAGDAEAELDALRSKSVTDVGQTADFDALRMHLQEREGQLSDTLQALRKREGELASAKRRVQRLSSAIRVSFGARGSEDLLAPFAGDESTATAVQDSDVSVSVLSGAEDSFFIMPGARPSKRSFESDLADEIEQVRICIEDAKQRVDFQQVEMVMQLRRAQEENHTASVRTIDLDDSEDRTPRSSVKSAGPLPSPHKAQLNGFIDDNGEFSTAPNDDAEKLEAALALLRTYEQLQAKRDRLNSIEGPQARTAALEASHSAALKKVEALEASIETQEAQTRSWTEFAREDAHHLAICRQRTCQLESTFAGAHTTNAEGSRAARDTTEPKVAELEERIQRRNNQIALHQEELRTVHAQLEALRTNLKLANDGNEVHLEEREKLQSRVIDVEERSANLVRQCADLEVKNGEAAAQLSSKMQDVKRLSAELDSTRKTLNALQASMSDPNSKASDEALLEDLASKTKALASSEGRLAEWQAKFADLQRDLEQSLQESETHKALLEAERSSFEGVRADAQRANEEIAILEQKLHQAQSEGESSRRTADALVEGARREAERRLEELESVRKVLSTAEADSNGQAQVLEDLRVQLSRAQSEAAMAERTANTRASEHESARLELESQIESAHARYAAELSAARERVTTAESQLEQARDKIRSLETEATSASETSHEVGALMSELEEARTAREQVSAKLAELQANAEKNSRLYAEEREEQDKVIAEMQTKLHHSTEVEQALSDREEQFRSLKNQYDINRANAEKLVSQLYEAKEEGADFERKAENAQRQLEKVSTQLKDALATAENSHMVLERTQSQLKEQRAAVESLSTQLRSVEDEKHQVQEELASARNVASSNEAVAQLEARMRELEAELETKVIEIEDNDDKMMEQIKQNKKQSLRAKAFQEKVTALQAQVDDLKLQLDAALQMRSEASQKGLPRSSEDRTMSPSLLSNRFAEPLREAPARPVSTPPSTSRKRSFAEADDEAATAVRNGAAAPTVRAMYVPVSPSKTFTPVRKSKSDAAFSNGATPGPTAERVVVAQRSASTNPTNAGAIGTSNNFAKDRRDAPPAGSLVDRTNVKDTISSSKAGPWQAGARVASNGSARPVGGLLKKLQTLQDGRPRPA
ncbi:hypothetical protein IE81DRAFT_323503 [Ceraceosorus guamensis]|uniref:Uncharacterized protein n=1 Tax=Ceraceosorus guamensis TaxID=1522189 RepID=A0A316W0U4_9BASI|nr:hypothetical protein IE81DRAFT_323503 [Ceraceosorus guamensis]PWN42353.1 hypothetical protein IE81DRAFT_323503 [Ceraceosorus guamensis]